MADNCWDSGDRCCAPPPLRFPETQAIKVDVATSCDADAACGCHGGVLRFDGLNARYKFVLWIVIGINGAMFLTEMAAGQLAGSQAVKADALDFLADTVTYGLSLAVIGATLRTRATAALLKGLSSQPHGGMGDGLDGLPHPHSRVAERGIDGRNWRPGADRESRLCPAAASLQRRRRQCALGLAVLAQ